MSPAPAPWMMPLDTDVLAFYADHRLRLTPHVLAANLGYSRQYVSERCRALKHAGLLFKDEADLYVLTPYGDQYLAEDLDPAAITPEPPATYEGEARPTSTNLVTADGVELAHRVNYDGYDITDYAWGYKGHGSKILALALLGDVADGATAEAHWSAFVDAVITGLDEEWRLAADEIHEFLEAVEN